MPSRACPSCSRRFPTGARLTNCPECKEVLEYVNKPANVEEDEFELLQFCAGKRIPAELTAEQTAEIEAEWASFHQEVARRGIRWSVPDLILERFGTEKEAA